MNKDKIKKLLKEVTKIAGWIILAAEEVIKFLS